MWYVIDTHIHRGRLLITRPQYFTHERGRYMGFYAFTLAGSNYFAPVICGFIAEGQGWQWVFFYPSIFLGVLFVFLFFFMEETNYVRKTTSVVSVADATLLDPSKSTDEEKYPTTTGPAEKVPSATDDTPVVAEAYPPPRTFVQKLNIWYPTPGRSMISRAIASLKYLSWPIIFYAGFSYGSYLIWFNVLNATASVILSAPPYNFSASMVGLSYLSCTIGVVVGAVFSGTASDWLTLKLARRNGGIMEAEYRLWPFTACLILVPCSLILWGVGAANGVHWFGLVFSMGMLACGTTFGVTLSINYLIDSYHDLSADGMVTVMLVRNTMSFAMSYGYVQQLNSSCVHSSLTKPQQNYSLVEWHGSPKLFHHCGLCWSGCMFCFLDHDQMGQGFPGSQR